MTVPITSPSIAQLTVRREISATAEELFDAFLDAESLAEFMRPASERNSDVVTDARVGGKFEINMHVNGSVIPHWGEYRELDRPRKLVFTWVSKNTNEQESVVTIHFHSVPGRTQRTEVVLTQVLLPDGQVKGHIGGWSRIVELLDEIHQQRADADPSKSS
ncbi:MAG: SRPBCC family protein [Gemmatimonadaceae bacterium]